MLRLDLSVTDEKLFLEVQAYSPSYGLAPPPPPPPSLVNKLILSQGAGEEQNHTTAREPGPLSIIQYSLSISVILLSLTSGFWTRVRARALRAPVFLGSLLRPTGRCAPLHPSQLRCSPQTKKNYFQKQNVSLQPQTRAARGICFPTGLRCALLSYAVPS